MNDNDNDTKTVTSVIKWRLERDLYDPYFNEYVNTATLKETLRKMEEES